MGDTNRLKKNHYVEGNLAAQIDFLPEWQEESGFEPELVEAAKKTVAIKVNREYTILLFLAILLFIGMCSVYLKSELSLLRVQKEANRLKAELQEIKIKNDQLEHSIHKTIDLEKIYDIAVNRLQMRLPERGEVHYIIRRANSYTIKLNQRSYSEKNNNLGQFLKFILKDW